MNREEIHNLTGNIYIETLGSIINYRCLADFLSTLITNINHYDCFLDLACGPGQLLAEIEKINKHGNFIGIDIDKRQINYAKKMVKYTTLILGDIFNLDDLLNCISYKTIFAHLGFCFMNTLDLSSRIELLKAITDSKSIRYLSIEIQNKSYQEESFVNGKWYQTKINDNKILYTMSQSFDSRDASKKLNMKFRISEKEYCSNAVMYDWSLDDCLATFLNFSWEIKHISSASYRKMSTSTPSHWFIVFCK